MKQEQDFYKQRTVALLTNFQLLELTLKMYIGTSYDYIRMLVSDHIQFDYSVEDVESFPLEHLLNVFAKLNDNKELQKRLNKLRKERNYIAHEALIVTIGSNPNMDTLHKKAEDFFYLEDELMECLKLLTDEFAKLKVKGEFSRITT
ncbi:hypothetical protein EXT48_07465 [Pseudoalteromonas sp. CO348]|uniref:hypothetical protein n=1 Tax=Pseudoalteromonas sp. CO348 TaxID=1777271 RepID=UPI0010235C80|nr:hypothetical protein [Pseudoalteromonas sp. CO348]RZG06785.1 hypothetical protein EXT48_07465 [Pseudoalteromonas sp. CO348]